MNDKMFGPTKVGVVGPAPPALIDMSLLDSTRLSESGPIGEEPQSQPNLLH